MKYRVSKNSKDFTHAMREKPLKISVISNSMYRRIKNRLSLGFHRRKLLAEDCLRRLLRQKVFITEVTQKIQTIEPLRCLTELLY